MNEFYTQVSGKWILAGEHAVLRGAMAIALPHPEFKLTLHFQPSDHPLSVSPPPADKVIQELLQHEIFKKQSPLALTGHLQIQSSIPPGAGLGSSAALCVALTHWLAEPLNLPPSQHFEFARTLENHFHGKSSGMDVAVALLGEPIVFTMKEGARPLNIHNLPRFTFHDTGLRASTRDCILRVEALQREKPELAHRTDEAMNLASQIALAGLQNYDRGDTHTGLEQIAQAMREAQECYYVWGLVPETVLSLEKDLLHRGALAVKLTGAGSGGYLVALWGKAL